MSTQLVRQEEIGLWPHASFKKRFPASQSERREGRRRKGGKTDRCGRVQSVHTCCRDNTTQLRHPTTTKSQSYFQMLLQVLYPVTRKHIFLIFDRRRSGLQTAKRVFRRTRPIHHESTWTQQMTFAGCSTEAPKARRVWNFSVKTCLFDEVGAREFLLISKIFNKNLTFHKDRLQNKSLKNDIESSGSKNWTKIFINSSWIY